MIWFGIYNMLRIKLSQLEQLYATAIIPRILKESTTVKKDIDKCSIDYFSKTTHKKYKSTASGSKDDDSSAKRKAIIDQCFPEKTAVLYENDKTADPLSKENVRLYDKIFKNDKIKDINTPKVAEVLQKGELQATAAKIEEDKLAHHIVHIDKTPLINISNTEVNKSNANLSVSEALQKDEDRAIAAELEKEKLAQDTYNIAKDNTTQRLLEIKQNANIQATTGKIKEEKLAQKIEQIDETPHVEAGVAKDEVSPKILDYDPYCNLSTREPELDNIPNQPEQVNLDELAKKCLGKPDDDVDQILLKELKNISRVNSMRFNLPKDDFYQKYFSQILQDKTKDNNNIVFDISDTHLEQILRNETKSLADNEMILDYFHPFHLDTVPIVTTDTRYYKNEFDRKHSPEGVKNLLLDIPAVLDPYEMQAIPFYQYDTKENIILKEVQPDRAPVQKSSSAGIIRETENNAPMNEEVILKREEEMDNIKEHALNNVSKDFEEGEAEDRKVGTTSAVRPLIEVVPSSKTTETPTLSESDISKLLEYKNVLRAQQEAFGNMRNIVPSELSTVETGIQPAKPSSTMELESLENNPLENATQNLLTTSTPTPTDPFGNPIQSEAGDTQDKRSDETWTDTAISAHQEPDEYFPTDHFNSFMDVGFQQVEYEVTDSSVTYTGVFDTKTTCSDTTDESTSNNLMSQNVSYYSTFPQLSDFLGNSEETLSKSKQHHLSEKERNTHILQEPKQEDIREELIQSEAKQHNRVKIVHLEPKPKLGEGSIQQLTRSEERVEASDIKDVDALSDETTPLSVLLRRVRERNRLELIRSVKMETEGAKKPPCLTPLDKNKQKTTMHPSPCRPKPKEKEKCPSPCKPPQKKDPCAKFLPFFLHTIIDVSIPATTRYDQIYTYISLAKEIVSKQLKHLSHILGFFSINYRNDEIDDVVCARDFNPWIPIPSWPIPKVEKKRPFACPKEGCKLPVHPVRSNTDKPCMGMPKKISPSKTVM